MYTRKSNATKKLHDKIGYSFYSQFHQTIIFIGRFRIGDVVVIFRSYHLRTSHLIVLCSANEKWVDIFQQQSLLLHKKMSLVASYHYLKIQTLSSCVLSLFQSDICNLKSDATMKIILTNYE